MGHQFLIPSRPITWATQQEVVVVAVAVADVEGREMGHQFPCSSRTSVADGQSSTSSVCEASSDIGPQKGTTACGFILVGGIAMTLQVPLQFGAEGGPDESVGGPALAH